MAKKKRKHGKRKRRTSAAQRAAARRNIKKAQRASRRGKRRGKGKRRSPKRGRKGYRKARTIRRPKGRRHWPRKIKRVRRRGRVRALKVTERKRRRRHGRRRAHALENPLSGMELLTLGVTAVAGIVIGDFIDRYIATRPGGTNATSGNMWATIAPPDIKRIAFGLGAAAVPLVAAHFVKMSPFVRSGLQGVGVGIGLQIASKVITMGLVKGLQKNPTVGLLYAPQISAQNMVATAKASQTIATGGAGTAGVPGLGAGPHGFGSCCKSGGSMCPTCQTTALKTMAPQIVVQQPPLPLNPPAYTPPTSYIPPAITRQPPGEQLAPRTPGVPAGTPPAMTPSIPTTQIQQQNGNPLVAGINGLGAAAETLRQFAPTVRALKQHAVAFSAVDSGRATSAQKQLVDSVSRAHAVGIGALNQFDRSLLQQAIDTYGEQQLGLGDAGDSNVGPSPYRHLLRETG